MSVWQQVRGKHCKLPSKLTQSKAPSQRTPALPQLKGYSLEALPSKEADGAAPHPSRQPAAEGSTAPSRPAAGSLPAHAAPALAPATHCPLQAGPAAAQARPIQIDTPTAVLDAGVTAGPSSADVAALGADDTLERSPVVGREPAKAPMHSSAVSHEPDTAHGHSHAARRERDRRRSKQKLAAVRGQAGPERVGSLPNGGRADKRRDAGAAEPAARPERGAPLRRPQSKLTIPGTSMVCCCFSGFSSAPLPATPLWRPTAERIPPRSLADGRTTRGRSSVRLPMTSLKQPPCGAHCARLFVDSPSPFQVYKLCDTASDLACMRVLLQGLPKPMWSQMICWIGDRSCVGNPRRKGPSMCWRL